MQSLDFITRAIFLPFIYIFLISLIPEAVSDVNKAIETFFPESKIKRRVHEPVIKNLLGKRKRTIKKPAYQEYSPIR